MIGPVSFETVPEFGTAATKIEPGIPLYNDGFVPEDMLPAQYLNWFLGGLTGNDVLGQVALNAVITELDNLLTAAGIVASSLSTTQVASAVETLVQQHISTGVSHTGGGAYAAFVGDVFFTFTAAGATTQDFSAGATTTGKRLDLYNSGAGIVTVTVSAGVTFALYQGAVAELVWNGTAWMAKSDGLLQYSFATSQTPTAFRSDASITVTAAGATAQDLTAGALNPGCRVFIYNSGAGLVTLTLAASTSVSLSQYDRLTLTWTGAAWEWGGMASYLVADASNTLANAHSDISIKHSTVNTERTQTLGALASNLHRRVTVLKDNASGAGEVKLAANGAEKFLYNGSSYTNIWIGLAGQSVTVEARTDGWYIIAGVVQPVALEPDIGGGYHRLNRTLGAWDVSADGHTTGSPLTWNTSALFPTGAKELLLAIANNTTSTSEFGSQIVNIWDYDLGAYSGWPLIQYGARCVASHKAASGAPQSQEADGQFRVRVGSTKKLYVGNSDGVTRSNAVLLGYFLGPV